MRIYKVSDYQAMCHQAANIVSAQIILKPDCILGLATGSTPEGIYRQLVEWYKKGDLDFSAIRSVNLDEYKGISRDNDQSYYYYMHHHLFGNVNIDPANTHIPNGLEPDSALECARYDSIISNMGGVDLQILGLGANGHIGFNEPSDAFDKGTHCVDLSESTIEANARFFASIDQVPRQAYTMGVRTIMQAKKILLVANGAGKADALYKTICGPITPDVPASALQLHNDVIIVADTEALSRVSV